MIRGADVVGRLLGGDPRAAPAGETVPPDVVILESGLVTGIAGRLAGMRGPAAAVTLGRTILVRPGTALTPRLLRHELEHVRQWKAWPYTFPVRYIWAHIREGYAGNRYERMARDAESGGPPPGSGPQGRSGEDS